MVAMHMYSVRRAVLTELVTSLFGDGVLYRVVFGWLIVLRYDLYAGYSLVAIGKVYKFRKEVVFVGIRRGCSVNSSQTVLYGYGCDGVVYQVFFGEGDNLLQLGETVDLTEDLSLSAAKISTNMVRTHVK